MNFLEAFLKEHELTAPPVAASASSLNSSNSTSKEVESQAVDQPGTLLITASNDWENAADKKSLGLDEPHKLLLDCKVKKTFSSSTSRHMFILCEDYSLYALGLNDEGQLGTGDTVAVHYPVLVKLPKLKKKSIVKKVATGRYHSVILFENGELYGCGSRKCGQIYTGRSVDGADDTNRKCKWRQIPTAAPVVDIACGHDFTVFCDTKGHVYTCGHPEYGQLGHGTTGEYMKVSGILYEYVTVPIRVEKFLRKDRHNKVLSEMSGTDIRIVAVSAGRNHVVCLEAWEGNSGDRKNGYVPPNRVFSFGFGGYGRLGHNSSQNELFPREIDFFSYFTPAVQGGEQAQPALKMKQIRSIVCGNALSIAVSVEGHLYFWGMNALQREAVMYPQIPTELVSYRFKHAAVGNSCVVATTVDNECIAWGRPAAGKFGFAEGATVSTRPQLVTAVSSGLVLSNVSCGYGHVALVVCAPQSEAGVQSETKAAVTTKPAARSSSRSKMQSKIESQNSVLDSFPLYPKEPPSDAYYRSKREKADRPKKRKSSGDDDGDGHDDKAENDDDGNGSESSINDEDNASGSSSSAESEDEDDDEEEEDSDDSRGRGVKWTKPTRNSKNNNRGRKRQRTSAVSASAKSLTKESIDGDGMLGGDSIQPDAVDHSADNNSSSTGVCAGVVNTTAKGGGKRRNGGGVGGGGINDTDAAAALARSIIAKRVRK